ncbi:hypothetical protein Hanom_Chr02g00158851 [Helianthus anomalus]
MLDIHFGLTSLLTNQIPSLNQPKSKNYFEVCKISNASMKLCYTVSPSTSNLFHVTTHSIEINMHCKVTSTSFLIIIIILTKSHQ